MAGKTDPPKVFSLALIEDPIRRDKWCLTVQNARLIPPLFQFFHLRRIIRVIEFFIPTKEALGPRALKKIDLSTESG